MLSFKVCFETVRIVDSRTLLVVQSGDILRGLVSYDILWSIHSSRDACVSQSVLTYTAVGVVVHTYTQPESGTVCTNIQHSLSTRLKYNGSLLWL